MAKFLVGDFVRVKEPIRIGSGLGLYRGQRGEVVRVVRSAVTVRFPSRRLTLKSSELVKEDQR